MSKKRFNKLIVIEYTQFCEVFLAREYLCADGGMKVRSTKIWEGKEVPDKLLQCLGEHFGFTVEISNESYFVKQRGFIR